MSNPRLVLASNSPRRRELLALGGWKFESHTPEVDESQHPGEEAGKYVLRLAESKARSCAASAHRESVIIAADTTVVDGKTILGKPGNAAEAVEMLRILRGRTHQVYSGIAVIGASDGNMGRDLCVTQVPMRDYDDQEIIAYVTSGDPLDKAGAYAIQHPEFHPVESMSGCYASVMGLPLCHLTRTLRPFGIVPNTDIAKECQSWLNYACPISARVLKGEQVG
ncbi:MAG: Maf family protein [Anaerolineales bacterium]|jgi:MAF protein